MRSRYSLTFNAPTRAFAASGDAPALVTRNVSRIALACLADRIGLIERHVVWQAFSIRSASSIVRAA
jgi:hypothetical protein